MSDRFRDFDAAQAEAAQEPVTFRLGGREWTAAHVGAGPFFQLVRRQAEAGPGTVLAVEEFLVAVLEANQRDDFRELISSGDVALATLRDLSQWITEQAVGAPFDAASSSPAPPSTTGVRPRVVSLSGNRASRRARRSAAG